MLRLADRDLGMDCDFVAMGETVEDVKAKMMAHAKAEHREMFESMSPEQTAEMEKMMESKIMS